MMQVDSVDMDYVDHTDLTSADIRAAGRGGRPKVPFACRRCESEVIALQVPTINATTSIHGWPIVTIATVLFVIEALFVFVYVYS